MSFPVSSRVSYQCWKRPARSVAVNWEVGLGLVTLLSPVCTWYALDRFRLARTLTASHMALWARVKCSTAPVIATSLHGSSWAMIRVSSFWRWLIIVIWVIWMTWGSSNVFASGEQESAHPWLPVGSLEMLDLAMAVRRRAQVERWEEEPTGWKLEHYNIPAGILM